MHVLPSHLHVCSWDASGSSGQWLMWKQPKIITVFFAPMKQNIIHEEWHRCYQGYAENKTAHIFYQTFQASINSVICCRLNDSQQQQWMILAKHNVLLLVLDFISASNHFRIWWKYSVYPVLHTNEMYKYKTWFH